ncbi:oligopeptide ABC transporter substrate-binding protein [Peribacillus sp. SCS-155]|uniref:oligopeptide ABC transporter substrate-binding protein n=1 Tax=Peribacillus sedimenti TaxID=3115297 RepID=UPI0039066177
MKLKKYSKVLSTLAVSALLLAACSDSSSSDPGKGKTAKKPEQVDTAAFPAKVSNDKADVDGSLTYGLVSDTPFEGVLNLAFYAGQPDYEVLQFFEESLLSTDDNWVYDQDGAATYELSNDNKTITIKIKDNVKWHDGNPVTAEDLEYAYLVIGSPKYKGVRYDSQFQLVEGMEAYHAGKADKISGVKVIDEKTISITQTQANPSMLTGLWTTPLNKKYLGDVPVDQLEKSEKIRKNPIGFGPFKVKKIVPGEAVEFERFDDYWKGKPKLSSVSLKVVNPQVAVASLEKGDIDFAVVSADQYDQAKALKNIELVGTVDLAYSYIGFKLGHWDADKSTAVMDNPKFADKKLRQAFAYAINNKEVGERMYKGLRFPANSVVPPSFPEYHNKDMKGYEYDPEKAKQLLDEAGYKDTNDDGLREDPNGKEFKINFASMSGGDIQEPLTKYYIQQWKDVGLDVEMLEGRLHEFNSFYERVEKDDPKIDIYMGAWGTGSDPDPSGLWATTAPFNYPRWVNKENEELLKKGISPEAFDMEFRKDVYNQWQELVHEEVPVIPTLFRYSLSGANKRVKGLKIKGGQVEDWYEVAVTADTPEK